MQKSDLYKSSNSLMESLSLLFSAMAIIGIIAGLFVGDWKIFLMILAGVALGWLATSPLANIGGSIFNKLVDINGWGIFEKKLSRQLCSVLSKKILMTLPFLSYLFLSLFFILTLVSNVQIMALLWVLAFITTLQYFGASENFKSEHDAPSLSAILIDSVFLMIYFIVISIATYFWSVDFYLSLGLFVVVFIMTNIRLIRVHVSVLRKAY